MRTRPCSDMCGLTLLNLGRPADAYEYAQDGVAWLRRLAPSPSMRRRTVATPVATAPPFVDAATGTPIATLTGHSVSAAAIVFNADGRTLAAASDDGTARLWEPARQRPLRGLCAHIGRSMTEPGVGALRIRPRLRADLLSPIYVLPLLYR